MNKLFSTLSKEELEAIAPTEEETTTDQGDGTAELEEGLEAKAEYEATADAVDAAVEELENLQEKDQMLAEAEESDDPAKQAAAVAVANEALRGACQRIGMDYEKYNVTFESLNLNADIKLAREGIGDTLKKGWEAVKKGLIAAWEFVLKYIKKFLGFFGIKFKDNEKKEKEVKEKADKLKQESTKLPPEEKKAVDTLVGAATGGNISKADLDAALGKASASSNDKDEKEQPSSAPQENKEENKQETQEAVKNVAEKHPGVNINTLEQAIEQGLWAGYAKNKEHVIESLFKIAIFAPHADSKSLNIISRYVANKSDDILKKLQNYKSAIKGTPTMEKWCELNVKAALDMVDTKMVEGGEEIKSFVTTADRYIFRSLSPNVAFSVVTLNKGEDGEDNVKVKEYKFKTAELTSKVEAMLKMPMNQPNGGVSKALDDTYNRITNIEKEIRSIANELNNIASNVMEKNSMGDIIKSTSFVYSKLGHQVISVTAAVSDLYNTQINTAFELLVAAEKITNKAQKEA